jgi:hypothetical protein
MPTICPAFRTAPLVGAAHPFGDCRRRGGGDALVLHWVVFTFLRRMGHRKGEDAEIVAAAQLYHAARWAMVATALGLADNADKLLAKIWGRSSVLRCPPSPAGCCMPW